MLQLSILVSKNCLFILGIYTAIDYFNNTSSGVCDASVYILCDSLTAIEAIDKMDVCIPPHAFKRLHSCLLQVLISDL